MREWLDSQKKPNIEFRKQLREWIDKANPRHKKTDKGMFVIIYF